MFNFHKKYPKHCLAILLVVLVVIVLFKPHLGYDWGPYMVREGDTLSEILTKAFDGNTFLAYAAINNLEETYSGVDVIWENPKRFSQDGDTIYLHDNKIVINKPNGEKLELKIFPEISYQKRLFQSFYYDLLAIFLGAVLIILIINHARGELLVSPSLLIRKILSVIAFILSFISVIILSGYLLIAKEIVKLYLINYFSMPTFLVKFISIVISFGCLFVVIAIPYLFAKRIYHNKKLLGFLIATASLFALAILPLFEIFYWFQR